MPTANVNIQYKNPPKEGRTNWSLKDNHGVFYSISPALASEVEAGQAVMLRWEEKSFNGGKPMNMVQEVLFVAAAAAQQQVVQPMARTAQPAPAPSQPASRPLTDQERHSRDIFVTGVVGRAMGGGADIGDMGKITQFAVKHWMEFLRD